MADKCIGRAVRSLGAQGDHPETVSKVGTWANMLTVPLTPWYTTTVHQKVSSSARQYYADIALIDL